ncbi:hypothetical protein M1M90_01950 [Thermodesulfovibrionales bacterium]|nr:hypothetical protein [Thermodesulfovibrionales bacterium]
MSRPDTPYRLLKVAARLRDITYGSRSDRGADALSTNLSMMQTCQLNKVKYFIFLKKLLSTHNEEELKRLIFNKECPIRGP